MEQLSKLNYFIPLSSRIGKEKPIAQDSSKSDPSEKQVTNRHSFYKNFSSYLLNRKQCGGLLNKRNKGIVLSLEDIVFDKDELYFVMQIRNNTSLDYDLNFLNFSLETRRKGKRKSLQKLIKEPLYRYNLPHRIAKKATVRFVYVLAKFSLSNERRVIVELNEKAGERNLKLKVSHRFVNNPR